jgi:ATP-binding cassette subfamily F protein 3
MVKSYVEEKMLLRIFDLEMDFNNRVLFSDVNLWIEHGEKIILIGPNGSGKTTLLNLIKKEAEPTKGRIDFYGQKMGSVNQFRIEVDRTLYEEGLSAFKEALVSYESAVQSAMKADLGAYAEALSQAELLDVYSAEKKVREMLKGVGFYEKDFERKISTLSAGEITRLEIAKLLVRDPDLLILDEPGNYLDIYGIEFLIDTLSSMKGAAIIATHDRKMMERIPDKIWDVDFGTVKSYDGKYKDFLIQKENFVKTLEFKENELNRQIDHLKRTIERYRNWGRDKAIKQAKSKEKFVDKLEKEREGFELKHQNTFKELHFKSESVTEEIVLKVSDLKVFAGEKYIGTFSFELHNNEKVALLGRNGIGKTTLLKAVASNKKEVEWGPNTSFAYVDTVGSERSDESVLNNLWKLVPIWQDYEVRRYIGRFGFEGDDAFKHVNALSGGEFVRYELAKSLIGNPNFLIMDEPTNHLDLYMIESLEDTLIDYNGGLFFTTHDLEFAEHIADSFFILDENGLHDFNAYEKAEEFFRTVSKGEEEKVRTNFDFEMKKKSRNKLKRIEKEIDECEKRFAEISMKMESIKSEMVLHATDHLVLNELVSEKERLEKESDAIIEKLDYFEKEKRHIEEEV